MRPDFVNAENTPALWQMAHEGVTFNNHHAAYPTMTEVNGTAISTGVYPNRSGLLANREYRPELDAKKPTDTETAETIHKADQLTKGKYLAVPTIAEIVRAAGKRAVIASTKTVGYLHDRTQSGYVVEPTNSVVPYPAVISPRSAIDGILRALGPFPPEIVLPNLARDSWTTRALTDVLWRDGVPEFSLLWMSEPDLSQHDSAPGSDEAINGMRSSDKNLAAILAALSAKNVREKTDVLVVSDHGFSTITRAVDIVAELKAAGFQAAARFEEPPKNGEIMVVGNAGTVLLYVIGHEVAVIERLVEWLQKSDFAGTIFSQNEIAGTFGLDVAHINSPHAPDVIFAFRWSENKNRFGVPGEIFADATRAAGKGSHATLSRFDLHNTLIAAGPHFRKAWSDNFPTGNIDIAPTVLHLLGISTPEKFDGRILTEALKDQVVLPEIESKTTEAERKFDSGKWRQSLKISRAGETSYWDEGSGGFTPK